MNKHIVGRAAKHGAAQATMQTPLRQQGVNRYLAKQPVVSCVIPCYNRAHNLEHTVLSVLAQDISLEVLIVDDCSQDNSVKVAHMLAQRDKRVRVIVQEQNQGPGKTRNRGAYEANGMFICFIDPGDTYLPGFFMAGADYLVKNPYLAGVKGFIDYHGLDPSLFLGQSDPRLLAGNTTSSCNVLMWRYLFPGVLYYPDGPAFRGEIGGEDYALMIAIQENFTMRYLQRKVLRYEAGGNSHMAKFLRRTRLSSTSENGFEFIEEMPEEKDMSYSNAVNAYCNEISARIEALRNLSMGSRHLPAQNSNAPSRREV